MAYVPPHRSGPRPSWSPSPSRATPAPAQRMAIPIAPPDAWDGGDTALQSGAVPPPSAFRTPAPAPFREAAGESPRTSSTLLVVGAGIGAVTAAAIGALGVAGVVVAVILFVPRGAAAPMAQTPPVEPVVVSAQPGTPTRAVVTRDVNRAGEASRRVASAPEPKGWVATTVQAVTSFVAPPPAPLPQVAAAPPDAVRPPPRVEPGPAAPGAPSAATAADYGLAVAAPSQPSLGDQIVIERPGSTSIAAAPVGRPLNEIVMPVAAPAPSGWAAVVDTVSSLVTGVPADPVPAYAAAPAAAAPMASSSDDFDDLMGSLGAPKGDVAARADDPALAVLAELDAPARTAPAPVAPAADPMDDLLADLEIGRSAPAPAPIVAPAAAPAAPAPGTGGWYDTVVAVGSSVASLVTGAEPEPYASSTFAAPPAAAPVGAGLGLDDEADLRPSRAASAPVGDAETAAFLADLDAPAPARSGAPTAAPRGAAAPSAAAPGSAAPAAAASAQVDLDTAALIASLDATPAPTAAQLAPPRYEAPAAAPAPAASGGWYDTVVGVGSTVASMMGDPGEDAAPVAPVAPAAQQDAVAALDDDASLGSAPVQSSYTQTAAGWANSVAGSILGEPSAPSAPAAAPQPAWAGQAATFTAPAATAAPAQRDCGEGEGCDGDLTTWRDDGNSRNLLDGDELELAPVARTSEAELFALPSESDDDSDDFDSFNTLLVNVTTDVPGIAVTIDGKERGRTPLVAELTPGAHTVQLFGGGDAVTTYRLNADQDPDEWCFELKGRSLKNVTCR